jgi:HK97 family phage major capsid protein
MELQDLRQKRTAAHAAMKDLRAKVDPTTGQLSTEHREAWDRYDAEFQALTQSIKEAETFEARERDIVEAEYQARQRTSGNTSHTGNAPITYDQAFDVFLRKGRTELNAEQRTALETRGTSTQVTGTDSLGGYAVPTGFSGQLEQFMKWYGPMLSVGRILNTSQGNPIEWPTVDDTAVAGALKTEASGQVAVSDLTLALVTLSSYTHTSSMVKLSRELLTDNGVNLGGLLPEMLGTRLGRGMNTYLTTGTGSSQPKGVVTCASSGHVAAATNAITQTEVLNLLHSVDRAYRDAPGAGFMMHDTILKAVRVLDIGNTNTVQMFTSSLNAGEPDRIFGKPVYINNDMASTQAANAKIALYGDYSKFIIRQVGGYSLERVEHLYQDYLNVGFFVWTRFDSNCIATGAFKFLANAAS